MKKLILLLFVFNFLSSCEDINNASYVVPQSSPESVFILESSERINGLLINTYLHKDSGKRFASFGGRPVIPVD